MERRSTNTIGFAHFQGDVWANVGSSHGIGLLGGSTGGIVEPVGDDTSIRLFLRGKNAGGITIGNSTQACDIDSTSVQIGTASTTPIERIQRYDITWTVPAMSSGSTVAETTVAVTGLTTNSALFFTARDPLNSSVTAIAVHPRCSTADELVLLQQKVGESSIGGSTARGVLLQFRF